MKILTNNNRDKSQRGVTADRAVGGDPRTTNDVNKDQQIEGIKPQASENAQPLKKRRRISLKDKPGLQKTAKSLALTLTTKMRS